MVRVRINVRLTLSDLNPKSNGKPNPNRTLGLLYLTWYNTSIIFFSNYVSTVVMSFFKVMRMNAVKPRAEDICGTTMYGAMPVCRIRTVPSVQLQTDRAWSETRRARGRRRPAGPGRILGLSDLVSLGRTAPGFGQTTLFPLCAEIIMKILVRSADQDTFAFIQLHFHLHRHTLE